MNELNDTPQGARSDSGANDPSSEINLPGGTEIPLPGREPEVIPVPPPQPLPAAPVQPQIGSASASGQAYYPPMMQPQTNAWAIISIVASILSWVGLFGLGGIVGMIAGWHARNEIKKSNGAQTGDSLALVGIILGGVNVALACIGILCMFGLFGFGIFAAIMDSGGR